MPDKHKKRDKRGLKLFFFSKPHGQKHKHKKNKYYLNHNDSDDQSESIMSGDSPLHHNRTVEPFEFATPQLEPAKPPTTTEPVPTTSQVGTQASVLVEPGGKNDEDKEQFGAPTLNSTSDTEEHKEEEKRLKTNNADEGRDKKDKKDDKFRKNGNIDRLDGVWTPKDKTNNEEADEDNCIVKCLYVTMTCCECSIM